MRLFLILCISLLSGCAGMVTSNNGNTVVIEHDFFIGLDAVQELALKACAQNGKTEAIFSTMANKNPRLSKGDGVQLSTFECK